MLAALFGGAGVAHADLQDDFVNAVTDQFPITPDPDKVLQLGIAVCADLGAGVTASTEADHLSAAASNRVTVRQARVIVAVAQKMLCDWAAGPTLAS